MANKCEACGKDVVSRDTMSCSSCTLKYHHQCLNVSAENFKKYSREYKASWKCPTCRPKDRKGDNTNTPIRTIAPSGSLESPLCSMDATVLNTIKEQVDVSVRESVARVMKAELEGFREQMLLLRDLKESVDFMSEEFDRLSSELKATKEHAAHVESENASLKGNISDLLTRVNNLEQHCRENNIEITGVPENRSENLVNVTKQILKAVSCPLPETEIRYCTRIRKIDPNNARPRAVIVKLSSVIQRDTVLAAISKFNKSNPQDKLNTHQLGYGGTKSPVFVSEHLSPFYKKLHAETRSTAREKGYKWVWVRNGHIFVRKSDTSPAKLISNHDALLSLHKDDPKSAMSTEDSTSHSTVTSPSEAANAKKDSKEAKISKSLK